MNLKEQLIKERQTLRLYIQSKLDSDDDYHAISDAANDIREIDAKLLILNDKIQINDYYDPYSGTWIKVDKV